MLAFEFSQWLMQEKTTDKSCCTQPSCYIVPFEGGTNCSQAARPCQASVRLRHLSVNARSLEWDGMISWGEKPALAPCAQRNSHMSQRAKKLSRPLHNWFLSMQREGTSFCALQQRFNLLLEGLLKKPNMRNSTCFCQLVDFTKQHCVESTWKY